MTVATTTNKEIGIGNGVATAFPFSFATLPTGDLVVTLINADGTETVQTEGSDYTVSGAGSESGGTVIFTTPPGDGVTVLIQRIVPYTQPTDYKNEGSFYPRTHEQSFDRATMQAQQLAEESLRTIKIPAHVTGFDTMLPIPAANELVVINADGTGFDLLPASALGSIGTSYTVSGPGAVEQTISDRLRQRVSLADFGAALDGVTNDATAFTNAVARAVALGRGRLHIPAGTLLLSSVVDAKGLILECDGTTIDGEIENHGGIIGGKVKGFRQDHLEYFPPETVTSSPKLLFRSTEDLYFVITRKPGMKGHGVAFEMIKGVTTTTNSLGVDQEFLRAGWVHNCTGVYAWRSVPDATTGTWGTYTLTAGLLGFDVSENWREPVAHSGEPAATIRFDVNVGIDGRFNVAVVGSSSTRPFEITIDGVSAGTWNANDWQGRVYAIPLQAAPGTRQVVITNTAGAGNLNVIGVDFHSIDEVVPGRRYDKWAAYRHADFPRYIQNEGAHDYAIFEGNANLWGGSYHGGEKALTAQAVLDGEVSALPVLSDQGLACYGDIHFRQRTRIDWTGHGGGSILTESYTRFLDGQIQLDVVFTGENGVVVDRMYTAMSGAHVDFNRIIFPIEAGLTYDGVTVPVGQKSKISLRNTASGAIHTVDMTLYPDHEGIYGGPRIEPESGSYAKIYHGPVVKGGRAIDRIAASTRRTFR